MNPNNTILIFNDLAKLSEEADKVITKAYPPCDSFFSEFKGFVDSTWSLICAHKGELENIQIPELPQISMYVGVIPTVENSCASDRNKSKARANQLTIHPSPAADNGKSLPPANSIQKVKKAFEDKRQASLRSAKKGTPAKSLQVVKQESNAINPFVKSVTALSRKVVEASENYEKRLSSDPKSMYVQKNTFNLKTALQNSNFKKMLEAENTDSSSKKKNKATESNAPVQKTKADKVTGLKTGINQKLTTFLPYKDYNATEQSFLSNSSAVKKPANEDIRQKLSLRRQQNVEEKKKKREEKFQKTKTTRLKLEKERDERILKLHKDKEERATKLTDSITVLDSKKPREWKKTNADSYVDVNTMVSTPVMKSTTKADRTPRQLNTVFMGNINSVVKEKNQGTVKRAHILTSKTELNSTYAVPDNQKLQGNEKSQKTTFKDRMATPNCKQPINNTKNPEADTTPKINVTFNQQKPSTYEMTPPPIASYDISDVKSDDDETTSSKPIPEWATGIMLKNEIFQQHYRNDCDKIFGTEIDMPDLKQIFDCQKNKNKYAQRSSSAVWNTPETT